jgi:hypothetical protein
MRVCAIPPKMKSVIPSTGIPFRRATTEWESSWPSRETKKRRVALTPIARYVRSVSPGNCAGKNPALSVQRMRKKMMNQE